MIEQVEISSFDLRYEGYRMKSSSIERELESSISEKGICEPLEGVDKDGTRILLNGFKRYRCAKKLSIGIVPYTSLGQDAACGIIQLLRISNNKSLTILEQAALIDDLRKVYKMSNTDIAESVTRSKSWVSVRLGIIEEMGKNIRQRILNGTFPFYSYMYTLRQFIRINYATSAEINEFVNAVSGKKLSIRDIEQLAYGYFRGASEFRKEIQNGNVLASLNTLKQLPSAPDDCNEPERTMLRDIEIIQKYMQKFMIQHNNNKFKNHSFYAQANLLTGGILSKINIFTKLMRGFYDRTGKM